MNRRTVKLIFGSICFSVTLFALFVGVILIFQSLSKIGEGEVRVLIEAIGEVSGVNGHLAAFIMGVAIVALAVMFINKSYVETLEHEAISSPLDVLRHHAPLPKREQRRYSSR